jgi:tmRNA-binding protein
MDIKRRLLLLNQSGKVAKFRKRKNINMGTMVFFIIFVYVFINVYLYFTKEHLSIYEVQQGFTSDNNTFQGLILREEEIFNTDTAGYVNYYHRDGERLAKNTTVYSIDETKQVYDLIGSSESGTVLTSADIKEVSREVMEFQDDFITSNFTSVYDFKYDLESTALEILNENRMTNLENIIEESGTSHLFSIVKSKTSGIITYSIDNYEDLTEDNVTAENFNLDIYDKVQLLASDLVEADTPIYRMVISDNWSIILLLDENQYNKLKEEKSVRINFKDNGLTTNAQISVYEKNASYFAKLELNKYIEYYMNQRFVSVELEINSAEGLKIPTSSIVQKEFYKIPLEYFTVGGDSGATGLVTENYSKNGELELEFVPADIYYSDETYGYVDKRLFENGIWIHSEETGERYQIELVDTLEGVFNVNKGYAIFRRIETLYENEEYSIIKEGTGYGLSVYDHIALVGSTAVEQAIIY